MLKFWLGSLINQAEDACVPASLSDAEIQASVSHFFPLTVFRSIYVPVGILFNQLHRYRADLSLLAGCVLVAVGLGAIN